MDYFAMSEFEALLLEFEGIQQPQEKISVLRALQYILGDESRPEATLLVSASTIITPVILKDDNEEDVEVLTEAVWTLLALAKISKKATSKIEELNVVGRLVKLGRDYPEASDLREACFLCVCLVFKKCKRQVLRDLGHDPNITVLGDFHSPCQDRTVVIRQVDIASNVFKMLSLEPALVDLRLQQPGVKGIGAGEEIIDTEFEHSTIRHQDGVEILLARARQTLAAPFEGSMYHPELLVDATDPISQSKHHYYYILCEWGGLLTLSGLTVQVPGKLTQARVVRLFLQEVKDAARFSHRVGADGIAKLAERVSKGEVPGIGQTPWRLQSRASSAMAIVVLHTPEFIAMAAEKEGKSSATLKLDNFDGTRVFHAVERKRNGRPRCRGMGLWLKGTIGFERLFRTVGSMLFSTTLRETVSSRDHHDTHQAKRQPQTASEGIFTGETGFLIGSDAAAAGEARGPESSSQDPFTGSSDKRIPWITLGRGSRPPGAGCAPQRARTNGNIVLLRMMAVLCVAAAVVMIYFVWRPRATFRLGGQSPVFWKPSDGFPCVATHLTDSGRPYLDTEQNPACPNYYSGPYSVIGHDADRVGTRRAHLDRRTAGEFPAIYNDTRNKSLPVANAMTTVITSALEYRPSTGAARVFRSGSHTRTDIKTSHPTATMPGFMPSVPVI